MKKYNAIIGFWLILVLISGCGSNTDTNRAEGITQPISQEQRAEESRKNWMSEEIALPQEAFYCETLYQNTLYYMDGLASDKSGGTPERTVIYQVDFTKESVLPVEIPIDLAEGQRISQIAADGEGMLHLLAAQYEGTETEERFINAFWLKVALDGTVTDSHTVGEYVSDQYPYVTGFTVDEAGNAYISAGSTVYVFDQGGSLSFQADCGIGYGGYITGMGQDKAGNIYICERLDGKAEKVTKVDTAAKSLGNGYDLSQSGRVLGIGPGTAGDMVLATGFGVFDYVPEPESLTERFRWLDLDISIDSYDRIFPLADGRLLIVDRNSNDYAAKATVRMVRERKEVEKAQLEEEKEKLSLEEGMGNVTLGWVSYEAESFSAEKKAIADFNRENPDSRIEVIEYGMDGYEAGINQLNMDIISGKCPDILLMYVGGNFPLELYAGKGVFVDLNPFMEADSSFKREDFQENILDAFETDGQLFSIPLSYSLEGFAGKTSIIGERDSWNMDEMMSFARGHLEDSLIFDRPTKTMVMNLCLEANSDSIVDWSGEESGFRSDILLKILEFANLFIDDEKYVDDEMFDEKIKDGRILLPRSKFIPHSFLMDSVTFGEPVSYIGYPSENGSGIIIGSGTAVAVSTQCEAKGTAWKFISKLLSEEVQENMLIPLNRTALDRFLERNVAFNEQFAGSEGEAALQEFREVIEKPVQVIMWDEQVMNIIREEAGAYFSGGKTAEEVVDIIENRVSVYLSEVR